MTDAPLWQRALAWLHRRADDIAVALLTAMFVSFILQIVFRYVIGEPLSWTLEACLLAWLWLVFWGGAFLLEDRDHVKFDIVYSTVAPGTRRVFAVISAVAIVAALTLSLPATADFIAFMQIESSSSLGIRLDYVFAAYLIFAVGAIVRYLVRAVRQAAGASDLEIADASGSDGPS